MMQAASSGPGAETILTMDELLIGFVRPFEHRFTGTRRIIQETIQETGRIMNIWRCRGGGLAAAQLKANHEDFEKNPSPIPARIQASDCLIECEPRRFRQDSQPHPSFATFRVQASGCSIDRASLRFFS